MSVKAPRHCVAQARVVLVLVPNLDKIGRAASGMSIQWKTRAKSDVRMICCGEPERQQPKEEEYTLSDEVNHK